MYRLQVTTQSRVYYASVTSTMHSRQCCNLLISWPPELDFVQHTVPAERCGKHAINKV